MPLIRKEIRNNAYAFVREWRYEYREHAEAKPFWEDFFKVFGVNRRRLATFEEPVKKIDDRVGFIDLLWKGKLLIEHKSRGKSLDKAYSQAINYFVGLKDEELPQYVLVSDFARFRLYDLDKDQYFEFSIEELPDRIHLFDFIAGFEDVGEVIEEFELNIKAAEQLGKLHDALLESGYEDHSLDIFLVRILFCLFAEDTGIFNRHQFVNYIVNYTREDGSDTDMHLIKLFQVLNKDDEDRSRNLSEELNEFPYVNGYLFSEGIEIPSFDEDMRDTLIECAYFDWATISPSIFGSLFQSVMDQETRRNLGAHYTSESNILRLIKPLFIDQLWEEFDKIKLKKQANKKQQALMQFQNKLSNLVFLDPACGCGNFLVITYRELRRLELEVLREQQSNTESEHLDLVIEPLIRPDQFYGIEIEEFPVRIAEVAMWLTQHQMNKEFARQFGKEPDLLPLQHSAYITHGNALDRDWGDVVAKDKVDFVLGNPPYRGSKLQSSSQKKEIAEIFRGIDNAKQLDYVACWFKKASNFMKGTRVVCAFVATNSITQGEQVAPLWEGLLRNGVKIVFAHKSFVWDSEAKGKAAVHVVIIGFTYISVDKRVLYTPTNNSEFKHLEVSRISPYLIDAPEIVVGNKAKPISDVPPLWFGNMPLDGGNLLLTPEEKQDLVEREPNAEKWLKPALGAREFLNNQERWCLWLLGITPKELRNLPMVFDRVDKVKIFREASKASSTQVHAKRPTEFRDIRTPETYILVPRHSSKNREYIPMGFFDSDTICLDSNLMIPDAGLYEFGVLESRMHMVWMRTIAGRIKSDYRYSAKLVYNNYPWPSVTDEQKEEIEGFARKILDARARYSDNSLADLYDKLAMPADLRKAHSELDKAVEFCYQTNVEIKDDTERLNLLLELYQDLVNAPGQGALC